MSDYLLSHYKKEDDFIANMDKFHRNDVPAAGQFDYAVYLAYTHTFATVTDEDLIDSAYPINLHEVYKKAAVVIRRAIRKKTHSMVLDYRECKQWIWEYNGYMYSRKMRAKYEYESSYISKEEWMQNQGY